MKLEFHGQYVLNQIFEWHYRLSTNCFLKSFTESPSKSVLLLIRDHIELRWTEMILFMNRAGGGIIQGSVSSKTVPPSFCSIWRIPHCGYFATVVTKTSPGGPFLFFLFFSRQQEDRMAHYLLLRHNTDNWMLCCEGHSSDL